MPILLILCVFVTAGVIFIDFGGLFGGQGTGGKVVVFMKIGEFGWDGDGFFGG